jgi:hypothetical protein
VPDDDQKKDPSKPATSPAEPDGPPPDEAAAPEDRFAPGAIAARVESLGEETELDRVARQEEQKLIERRQQKKGKKGAGLEAAASKRLARIGEDAVKRPSAASIYVPEADPLVFRMRGARQWIQKHRGSFAALVGVAVVAVASALGWSFWQTKRNTDASALLAEAFADEHGHIADKAGDDEDEGLHAPQLYPTFKSVGDLRSSAIAKYREVASKFSGTGAATLARLAEAGLLLDQGDAKGALGAYDEVAASPLARADTEVRGRALEGHGFADELLAATDASTKDKSLDDALATYKSLEQVDGEGFKELGQYHQARVIQAKGDKAKAIELLKDLYKQVSGPGMSIGTSYLEFVVEDRLRDLDPTALPPKAPKKAPGGGPDMSNPQIQELLRKLQQQQGGGMPGAPPPGGVPPPGGAP